MDVEGRRLLVCDCEGTMDLDGRALAKACGRSGDLPIARHLCRTQLDIYQNALEAGGPVMVACTQEAPLFRELAEEFEHDNPLGFFNIRERAGWSADGAKATPKIAALIAEAMIDVPSTPTVTVDSGGHVLVIGPSEHVMEPARQLAQRMKVSVLITGTPDVIPPRVMEIALFTGTVAQAGGHVAGFTVSVRNLRPMAVSSRAELRFGQPSSTADLDADIILDLTGGAPLFPSHERRDGYLRPDPGNPAAVQKALYDLTELTGELEKPRYVDFRADLCAHSRSKRTGCTRCLDVCPASAITSAGDSVAIDPWLCGGCGACHSVCPTGAATYAYPKPDSTHARVRTLLKAYREAGGRTPVLLVHDDRHGADMIALMARYGRGLPAHVIPFEVNEVTQTGFDTLSTMLAFGAAEIVLLADPLKAGELAGLELQVEIANNLTAGLGHGPRARIMAEHDPDTVEGLLWDAEVREGAAPAAYLPTGAKRGVQRLALDHLHATAPQKPDAIALPAGAPFGRVQIDTDGCTLCLACVGACPQGALLDNPDKPQLRFLEDACIQCGLCKTTCPEKVIALEPRFSFTPAARTPQVVKEEEPAECVRCGKAFGTKSSVERIVTMLAGKHPMFADPKRSEIMRMCDDCRVNAQFTLNMDPMAGGPRRPTRTTEDYLREREEIEAAREAEKRKKLDS